MIETLTILPELSAARQRFARQGDSFSGKATLSAPKVTHFAGKVTVMADLALRRVTCVNSVQRDWA